MTLRTNGLASTYRSVAMLLRCGFMADSREGLLGFFERTMEGPPPADRTNDQMFWDGPTVIY